MGTFKQDVAIVTGGGSGIGEAAAKRLAKEGAHVIIVGRTASKLERVASSINEAEGEKKAFPFVCDVTSKEEVDNLAEYVEKEFGNLTVLVNNAGGSFNAKLRDISLEQWEDIQKINANSVFYVSKRLGEVMTNAAKEKESVDRSIINIASLSGHKPGALFPHYSAAKASVINLTKAFAFEYAKFGIRVNSISPGFVETDMIDAENEKMASIIERKTTMRRFGKPEEIANVVHFLASEEASYVTGIDILVDGGYMLT